MDKFLKEAIHNYQEELTIKFEVYHVLNDIIENVIIHNYENEVLKKKNHLLLSEELTTKVMNEIMILKNQNNNLTEQLHTYKSKALLLRESFMNDIGECLIESKNSKKLKIKIKELEMKIESLQNNEYSISYVNDNNNTTNHTATSMIINNNINETENNIIDPSSNYSESMQPLDDPTIYDNNSNQQITSYKITSLNQSSHINTESSFDISDNDIKECTNIIKYNNKTSMIQQELFIYDIKDELLLNIFSYLDTIEVLYIAQANKYLFQRIDSLFGIESSMITSEWKIRPSSHLDLNMISITQKSDLNIVNNNLTSIDNKSIHTSTIPTSSVTNHTTTSSTINVKNNSIEATTSSTTVSSSSSNIDNNNQMKAIQDPILTKEIIDILIKKLTASELKVILSIAERTKKQSQEITMLTTEIEDLLARIDNTESVRNFLIEKLKSAEMEIKSLMSSTSSMKKQTMSDHEIISYLDQRVYELEKDKLLLANKNKQLQANLDLYIGSHSYKEIQLAQEIEKYKLEYETLDNNFKSQKKILIKEVKMLRKQVNMLTNDKNIQANRFRLLREALCSDIK